MLRNTMTDNKYTLFCIVDEDTTPFPVEIEPVKTIGSLKKAIKDEKAIAFADVDADMLTLWRVSIPVADDNDDDEDDFPIHLSNIPKTDKKKLKAVMNTVSDVFGSPDGKSIHVIIQRPPPVQTHLAVPVPVRARSSTPFSDESRPGTPLSGDLRVDLKRITDKFFAPGSRTVTFLDSFVRGKRGLPVTTGPIRGLPRAWRRGFGVPSESRPSLLFLDLPDPSTPDSESRNLASTSILHMVKENNRLQIPVFGVSGCGKTRAVIELLSQHWGFYFNASSDDWGSGDMITLHSTVQKYLKENQGTFIVDRQVNNAFARKTTLLLFLSRLLIFKHCLNIVGSSDTFTSARWALLQVCPHVFFMDIFNSLFRQLLNLRHHSEIDLSDFVRNQFEDTKLYIIKHGGLPKIKEDTRLLVVHDEAQFLGDEFNGDFQSMSSSDESPRPLLSPILHAFRDVGDDQLTLVTCGTGLSINTLYWVQSSGSGLKDSSTNFEYMEFPGWTDQESIRTYVSQVRRCLSDDESRQALEERLPQEAIALLFEKLVGRFRPAIVAIEKIIERDQKGTWKLSIEDTEDRLVSWKHRNIKGNMCYEISRLHDKHNKYKDQVVESIDSILGLLMYQRCMAGSHDLVLKEVDPLLVEHSFGRIKIIRGNAVTVLDEPFVSKAVENYFIATDPYFKKETRKRMVKSTPSDQGCVFERFMMNVFSETFSTQPLSEWPHEPPILEMCPALAGKVEIVGWKESGLQQGTTHAMMSMEEFMHAHVNQESTNNNMPVAPFFFPKSKPSGPDLVFFLRVNDARLVPVFVQMKLHQGSSNFSEKDWNNALSTVSAAKIETHAKNFRKYCPDNIYISMIIAYPTKWTDKLPAPSELEKDESGVQQVVINVSDNNFGDIFPRDHVEFINRLKNARKRSGDDDDDSDNDQCKKKRT